MSIFALRSNGLASSAYKNLSRAQTSLTENISRLASGLRINKTADNSAGSNVSVRMGNQVSGMAQANRNAQDANNLLATAESGLSDISDILGKMRELSVQASTDTLNDVDRASINLEFQALKDELTRVANVTEYNGMNLLNGTHQTAVTQGNMAEKVGIENPKDNKNGTYVAAELKEGDPFFHDRAYTITNIPEEFLGLAQVRTSADSPGGQDLLLTFEIDQPAFLYTAWDSRHTPPETRGQNPNGWFAEGFKNTGETLFLDNPHPQVEYWIYKSNAPYPKGEVELQGIDAVIGDPVIMWTIFLGPPDDIRGHWRIQIGADNDINNQHEFSLTNATANGLDLDTDNVTTVDSARDAITAIDHAIDEVNRERSYIQNIEASRSSIEDADFAAEAVDLAKIQILAQSATAMLVQASA